MTDKFKKMSIELDALSRKTTGKKVKTRKQARDLSLKKWKAIRKMCMLFFDEFNTRCGFCGLGEVKAAKKREKAGHVVSRCQHCGVKTICDEMIEKAQNLEEETLNLIDGLIKHFETMKVAD